MINNRKKGFTLVELLAVIVILAIILVIAVPKVMDIINDAKKGTLESTAKMIASQAEKQEVQNTVLGNTDTITCDSVAKINNVDYESCTVEFEDNTAKVTIAGSGKFEGLNVCGGTKTNSVATEESCGLRTLTVESDGGDLNTTYKEKYEAGSEVTLTIPTKEGYTFVKWIVESGTGASVTDNKLIMGSDATKIKAMWEVQAYGAALTIKQLLQEEEKFNNGLIQTTAEYNGIIYNAGIRYAGKIDDVNNQVYYNCEDKDSNNISYGEEDYNYVSSCEIWRIIGVFDVSNGDTMEKRVKLINMGSTFTASWDSSIRETNFGYGINQWGPSTMIDGSAYLGADIMQLLNGYYIEKNNSEIPESNKKECKYNIGSAQSEFSETCDTTEIPLSSLNMKPLTSTALSMIDEVVWDTYAVHSSLYPVTNNNASDVYLQEKGISIQYTGKSVCEERKGNYCNDRVKRTTSWTGLVGLMSAADVGYAKGWLGKTEKKSPWTMSVYASSDKAYQVWFSQGGRADINYGYLDLSVFPSLYLKADIKIISGNGKNEPYILGL